MEEKVGIIVNPHASGNRKIQNLVARIKNIIGNRAYLEVTENLTHLKDIAKQFVERGITLLGISGGDGTLHHTITTFINILKKGELPKIFLLCGGTMNTIATALKIKEKQERALAKIKEYLDGKRSARIIEKSLIKIEEKYGFIFGGGLVSTFLNEYYSGDERGPLKAAKVIWRFMKTAIFKTEDYKRLFPEFRGRIKTPEGGREFEKLTAFIGATVREIGLHFKITHRADSTNKFHFLATEFSPYHIILRIPKLFFGIPIEHPLLMESVTENVEIELDRPFLYTMDGDIYTAENSHLIAELGPSIKIISAQ